MLTVTAVTIQNNSIDAARRDRKLGQRRRAPASSRPIRRYRHCSHPGSGVDHCGATKKCFGMEVSEFLMKLHERIHNTRSAHGKQHVWERKILDPTQAAETVEKCAVHCYTMVRSSSRAVLSPPALFKPWKLIV